MDETPHASPPTQRAEEMMGRAGQWLGGLVLGAMRGMERAASGSSSASDPGAEPAATTRAEGMLDGAGERVGHVAALAGQRLRTAAALAREEMEDLWAEAQHLRGRGR